MKTVRLPADPKPKKHFTILLNGQYYAESWAVSAEKAIANAWWKYEKGEDAMNTNYHYTVDDFDAVEM